MDIQTFIIDILYFINDTLIPFLLAFAFLIFLWNVTHYFIIGGADEGSQEKARSFALWGIGAFVIILGLWGIINIFTNVLNLDNRGIIPDYMCEKTEEGYCRSNERVWYRF